ncbi:MAG TPA: hypothetical protein VEN81_08350 [Planctomycetota bacterium]|nr:hypothetical protein [Planctomycetota bacterium]
MRVLAAWLVLAGSIQALAQEDPRALEGQARQRAAEARLKAATRLESVDGVQSVNLGGTGTEYRLIIVTRDHASRQAASRELGAGDWFEGVRITWSGPGGWTTPVTIPDAPPKAPAPQGTAPAAPPPVPSYPSPVLGVAPISSDPQAGMAGPYLQTVPAWGYSLFRHGYGLWYSPWRFHHPPGTSWGGSFTHGGMTGGHARGR